MYMKILKQKEEVDRQKLRAYGLDLFSLKLKKKCKRYHIQILVHLPQ